MASKLHRRTLKLMKEIFGCAIKEEINVKKLFPNYPARNHHYDLVIPSYNLIVECHGEQHRTIQSFGNKDPESAVRTLYNQKHRDSRKEEIAWENQWGYVIVWPENLPKDDVKAKEILKTKALEAINRIDEE